MDRATEAAPPGPSAPAEEPALELLVHGVGGTTPAEMLDDPRTVRITGDERAAVYRRPEDVHAEDRPPGEAPPEGAEEGGRPRPIPEAYVWSNLTSGNGSRALWLLLLPFMVVNLAHWMRPSSRHRSRAVRGYGMLVRLAGLTLTLLLTAAACEVALDLTAWQCAGTRACAAEHSWLGFVSPELPGGGWWSQPGRRLALASLAPAALMGLLWFLSRRTWSAYESALPLPPDAEAKEETSATALAEPGFWYGRRLVARLRAAHTAAGLLTVAAAVGTSAARFDRRDGGPVLLDVLGRVLEGALALGFALVLWVVCRRGRSERRADDRRDGRLVRALPAAALALLALSLLYASWSRPRWRSEGRLPGDFTFGSLVLVQGALVVVLGVVAYVLQRRAPESRTALGGQGGPAVTMLACALGGVMSGGVAQRVGDWLDGAGTPGQGSWIPGPPVMLTWQASGIPVLLLALLVLFAFLAVRTTRRTRAGIPQVHRDYPDGPHDIIRTRRIAGTRARARLTDEAPLLVGVTAGFTLLLGAAALAGAWATGEVPAEAARGEADFVSGGAQVAQALGSWFIGLGFVLLVTSGRRAYRDASARRTIGILWDVGTFWPRAAHPFAPPCYAERAVPDLSWRMATWTRTTGGRLVISGHSQGSVLAAAAAWQLSPAARRRVALLTYGSPLERLYGRWFPAHFGPRTLHALHRDIDCWRNLHRETDPIGGPVRVDAGEGPEVDRPPLRDPLAYGRTQLLPLPAPILGHSEYQADPAFAEERELLLARLRPAAVPGPRPGTGEEGTQTSTGTSSG
ncbi:hypothetical protein DUI70_0330 [Streptomyces albus]|nr:hypothetical protein DUI70_0330 [Streptomyces albus]